MAKIKEVSSYNGTSWDSPVPIGANDANIDITSSTTNPTDTTATSAGLVDSSVTVVSGDTAASAWTKFNRFRKRVQNAFGNFAGVTLRTAYNTSNTDTSVYTTGVINNYMSNVIGYTGTTAPSAGTVASQLSSLNSNKINTLPVSKSSFSAIPTGITGFYCVTYSNASDSSAPNTNTGTFWWNVMQIGNSGGNRIIQLTWDIFNRKDIIYWRIRQDSTWSTWYRIGSNLITALDQDRAWKNAITGYAQTYYYEGPTMAATYDLPIDYCFVIVEKYGSNRGIAIAIPWVGRNITEYECWINPLFESWKGWKKIGANNLFNPTSVILPLSTSLVDSSSWGRMFRNGYERVFSCAVVPLTAGTSKQIATLGDTDKPLADVQFVCSICNSSLLPGQITIKSNGAIILDAPQTGCVYKANIAFTTNILA